MTEAHTTIHSVHALKEQQSVATADSINQALTNTDGSVFVFYSHPSIYVANKLQQGENGKQACNDWLKGINEALTAQRKNRRRVRLLCVQDALEHGSELNQQTGLTAEQLSDYQAEVSDLELMAGHQLVLQNDDIMQLIERLEASTLQLSEQAYRVAVDVEKSLNDVITTSEKEAALKREFDELKQKHELTLKYAEESDKEQKEENELLLLQLQQVQEELEQALVKSRDTNKERKEDIESLNQTFSQTQRAEDDSKELEQTKGELDDAKEENELLLLQLQQVQEELEHYFVKSQQQDDKAKLESRIKDLESENQLLMEQASSHNTSVNNDEVARLEKENAELMNNLLSVQEALEQQLTQPQNTEAVEKLEAENQRLKQENQRTLQQLFTTQEQLSERIEEAEKLLGASNEAELVYKKFKQEQAKAEQFRDGLARAQQQLLEQRLKETSKKPLAKSQKVKNKLLNVKKIDRFIPKWLSEQIQQIEHSPLFDKDWYLQQYPDLAELDIGPAEHFVRYGGFENRNPGPNFDTKFYTKKYPDVLAEGMNPLLHFILHGEAEGRLPKAGQQS